VIYNPINSANVDIFNLCDSENAETFTLGDTERVDLEELRKKFPDTDSLIKGFLKHQKELRADRIKKEG
jgi:hypothetical protein